MIQGTRDTHLDRRSRLAMVLALPFPLNRLKLGYNRSTLVATLSTCYCAVLFLNVFVLLLPPRLALTLVVNESGEARIVGLVPGSLMWKQGVRPGDQVLALDGRSPQLASSGRWTGEHVVVRSKGGDQWVFDATDMRATRNAWPLLVLSPWFFLLGTLVFLRATPTTASVTYALFTSAALALAMAPASIEDRLWAVAGEFVVVPLFAGCFLLFFLVFPVVRGSPRMRAMVLLLPILDAGLSVASLARPSFYAISDLLTMGILLLYLLAGTSLIIGSLVTLKESDVRQGLIIVASGTTASVMPFIGLYVVPVLLDGVPLLVEEYAILPLALLPVSFAYAILRHQVLPIRLLQRWLVRGLLWLALLVVYAPLIYLWQELGKSAFDEIPEPWRSVALAATLLLAVGVSFSWLRNQLQATLDHLIFKDSYDYRTSLQCLSRDLSIAGELDTLAEGLPAALCHLMNLDFSILMSCDGHELHIRGVAGGYDPNMLPGIAAAVREVREAPATISLPDSHLNVLLMPLHTHDHIVGYLCLGPKSSGEPFRDQDYALLATISGQIAAIMHNAQLIDELSAKVVALDALNERLENAQEEERARLAAEIHDEPLQTLIELQRQLTAIQCRERCVGSDESRDTPQSVRKEHIMLSQIVIDQLRAVCTAMRPPNLDDLGLYGALDTLTLEQGNRSGVPVVLDVDPLIGELELSPLIELVLYRVVQEAISNSLRHAEPQNIHVSLRLVNDAVEVSVIDDGIGFSVPRHFNSFAAAGHFGLASMRERVKRIGGQFVISSAPSSGTALCVEIPLSKVLL